MESRQIELVVEGQKEGAAKLRLYLLDPVSVSPQKRRPMVIVVPGGGYEFCSDREQEPVAMRFLAMGCHACVLDYSVAPNRFPVALRELSLAIAVIRENAKEWHVDSDSVLLCGFSAGAHLALSAGAFWHRSVAYESIGRKAGDVCPDGLILCYPVVTSGRYGHRGSFEALLGKEAQKELLETVSLELQMTPQVPPVFLWHTVTDDSVPVENSLLLAEALRKNRVNFELHIYPSGGHGLSLASEETGGEKEYLIEPCCQSWISLVQSWIENRSWKRRRTNL